MNDCKKCRDLMIEALYGELGPSDREVLDRHRETCPACAAEYESLRGTLELMDKRERPDPGLDFWEGYWDRLSRRIVWETTGEGRPASLLDRLGRLFPRLPRWSYQLAGAAALVLVGILIGRLFTGPAGSTGEKVASRGPAVAGGPSPAVVQAADFVDRSKVLLLGLVNFNPAVDDAYGLDLDRRKAMSRELAAGAPALRRALGAGGQKRLRDLVGDLEVILMQIANLGAGHDIEGLDIVKQGVDQRGIFLRIDLDRLGRDARAAAVPASPGSAGTPKKKRI
jgi:Putative zinc-finger